jgi:hypothetical protein
MIVVLCEEQNNIVSLIRIPRCRFVDKVTIEDNDWTLHRCNSISRMGTINVTAENSLGISDAERRWLCSFLNMVYENFKLVAISLATAGSGC